jgi:hypothetical protein
MRMVRRKGGREFAKKYHTQLPILAPKNCKWVGGI